MMENQWGPIADRTQEHLTSSDYQIIHIRRRLLKAAEAAGGRAGAHRALAPGGLPLPPHGRNRRNGARGAGEGEGDRVRQPAPQEIAPEPIATS